MFSTFKSAAVLALVSVACIEACGVDQSLAARCLTDAHPTKYQLSKAVARIRTSVTYCTAWLWGSEGHLITNNHCVPDESVANETRVELGSECSTCDDFFNDIKGACIGTLVVDSTTFVFTDYDLDMTLLKLNVSPDVNLTQYGYLQSRATNVTLDDQIYILGHPGGKPKHIAFLGDDGTHARITNASMPAGCGEKDTLGYNVDSESGSSGSPVLSPDDDKVVAMHNCGGCELVGQNTGIKMPNIVALLKSKNLLPKDAVADDLC
ncbi:hypothetical protein DYB37_013955 [Aphanomyces astaci]|uniref:Serine protease n=2 Tax=Aphanomyces astaci TaxID=112090 RepID=A0A3R7EQC8_APHAT|nr:hypothetical protein AaE_016174 [Aphanomyces astaci]RHZ10278.1 hypothetical protein DYB37_013955 [Aphanomyces astaci]